MKVPWNVDINSVKPGSLVLPQSSLPVFRVDPVNDLNEDKTKFLAPPGAQGVTICLCLSGTSLSKLKSTQFSSF